MSHYDAAGSWSMFPPPAVTSDPAQPAPSGPPTPPAPVSPQVSPEPSRSATTWPSVIGILSIVFGSLGVLTHGFQAVMLTFLAMQFREMTREFGARSTMPPGNSREWIADLFGHSFAVMSISSVLLIMWSVLLVIAGVQLLRRRQAGVVLHVVWAVGKLFLSLMMILPMVILLGQVTSMIERMSDGGGGRSAPTISLGFAIAQVGAGLVIAWSYPLFVLTWLSIRKLR